MAKITFIELSCIVGWMNKKFSLELTEIEIINDTSNGDIIFVGRDLENEIKYSVHYNPSHYDKSVYFETSQYVPLSEMNGELPY